MRLPTRHLARIRRGTLQDWLVNYRALDLRFDPLAATALNVKLMQYLARFFAIAASLFCVFAFSEEPHVSADQNPPKHTNALAKETSPYLLQHAHNPVHWHPWGEEAFAIAKREDKPIFLSVGYSSCHWCHVMERESF
jgi:hypothetical protein